MDLSYTGIFLTIIIMVKSEYCPRYEYAHNMLAKIFWYYWNSTILVQKGVIQVDQRHFE